MTRLIPPYWVMLLSEVGGWECGCQNQVRYANYIALMTLGDYITTRVHFSSVCKEGALAWEITDKGLQLYAQHFGLDAMKRVEKVRKFYRDNSSTLAKAKAWYELKTGMPF